jgi:hypothetical protein
MPLLYIKASNRGYFLFDNGYSSHNCCERQLRWQRLVWGVRRGRRRRSCGCRGLTLNPQHRSALRLGLTIPRIDPRDIPPSARHAGPGPGFPRWTAGGLLPESIRTANQNESAKPPRCLQEDPARDPVRAPNAPRKLPTAYVFYALPEQRGARSTARVVFTFRWRLV